VVPALDEALLKLLAADRLELDNEDKRLLELLATIELELDRLEELTLAGVELERLDEATTIEDWLDDETVGALNAAISFLTLFSASAAFA
jgi:hypothetical protein